MSSSTPSTANAIVAVPSTWNRKIVSNGNTPENPRTTAATVSVGVRRPIATGGGVSDRSKSS